MERGLLSQVVALQRMTVEQLIQRWREEFDQDPKSKSREKLWRGLAQRIQEDHYLPG